VRPRPALRTGVTAGRRPAATGGAAARAAARRARPALLSPAPGTGARGALTSRAAVLGLVLCALLLSAAVPLREFLAQRGDIGRTATAQAEQRQRIAALEAQQQRLNDPAYVRQQARERFGFVLPGETLYTVLRPGASSAPETREDGTEAVPEPPARAWYGELWDSVQQADRPAPTAVPQPLR
jgi:cell division protein FtsB